MFALRLYRFGRTRARTLVHVCISYGANTNPRKRGDNMDIRMLFDLLAVMVNDFYGTGTKWFSSMPLISGHPTAGIKTFMVFTL